MTYLFICTTLLFGVGCFFQWLSAKAIVRLWKEKGYKLPSETEIRACTLRVLKERLPFGR